MAFTARLFFGYFEQKKKLHQRVIFYRFCNGVASGGTRLGCRSWGRINTLYSAISKSVFKYRLKYD